MKKEGTLSKKINLQNLSGLLKDLNLPTITSRDIEDVTSHPFIKAVDNLSENQYRLKEGLDKIAKLNDPRTIKRERDDLFEKHTKCVNVVRENLSPFCQRVDPLIAKIRKFIPSKPDGSLGASFSLGMGVRFRFERDPSYREAFWEKIFRESIQLPPKDHLKALESEHGSIEALKKRIEEKREDINKEIKTLEINQQDMALLITSGLDFKFTKAGIPKSFHIETEGKGLLNLIMDFHYDNLGRRKSFKSNF